MKRLGRTMIWAVALGVLGLIAGALADGPTPAAGARPASGSTAGASDRASKEVVSIVIPRDDAVSRTSQDVPAQLPQGTVPVPADPVPTQRESVPPPPSPMDALPNASGPAPPSNDASALVSIHYDNTDIRQALEIFSRREKMNLLVSPNVTGSITVNLDGITRQQAFEAIMSLGNLVAQRLNGLTYIYNVDEFRALNLSKRQLITRVFRLNYVRASDVSSMITQFISPSGKVTTTPESVEGIDENANFAAGLPTVSAGGGGGGGGAGGGRGAGTTGGNTLSVEDMIVVQDYPQNLAIIGDLIAKLDVMPIQVLIEATIIRVDLNRTQQLGVNIGAVDTRGGVLGILGDASQFGQTAGFAPLKFLNANGTISGAASIPAGVAAVAGTATSTQFNSPGNGIRFGYIGGNVSTFVQALETLGKTNVLATPRVLVLNKQRAEIQLGQRLGYRTLVTNLTSTVQQVQFINTGTLLRLRPFISDDSMIRMEIHPERSTGLIDANGVPQVNTARMTTNVIIPNGATLVIGGLIDNQDDANQSGTPGLNRLPVVGALFRSRTQDVIKSEVVVLLTPRVWNAADPEGLNCAPTTKTSIDTATRVSQKIELGADRPFKDGLLGGRLYYDTPRRADKLQANDPGKQPYTHTVRSGENFWTISKLYYRSGRYYMCLWDANRKTVPAPDRLVVGDKIIIPRADQLNPEMIPQGTMPGVLAPEPVPVPPAPVPVIAAPPPPLDGAPGPFGQAKTRDPSIRVASGTRVVIPPAPKPDATPAGR